MENIAKIIINKCVQPSEEDGVLIVCDEFKKHIADFIFKACKEEGLDVKLVVMPPIEADGQEPDPFVAGTLRDAKVVIAVTKWSISHTDALAGPRKNGAKIISMPAVTEDILKRCIPVDYGEMTELTAGLAGLLDNAEKVKIVSGKGSDLALDLQGFKALRMDGIAKKGELINLPDGEACIGVKDAWGTLVIDGSMPPDQKSQWGTIGKISHPIRLTIESGSIIRIEGKREAGVLKKILSSFDDSVYQIAELGIGTNPQAKLTGNVTEDEKILGTVHVAFGDNTTFGGRNISPLHLDGVIVSPTLKINGKLILKGGRLNRTIL